MLIVDDEAPIRNIVERVLRSAGYDTAVAADGEEALHQLHDDPTFDLLLTDLVMPRMTGDKLAQRAREVVADLKVLYLTGYADQLFNQRSFLESHEAFLEKPVVPAGLLEAVSLILFGTTASAGQRVESGLLGRATPRPEPSPICPRCSATKTHGLEFASRVNDVPTYECRACRFVWTVPPSPPRTH